MFTKLHILLACLSIIMLGFFIPQTVKANSIVTGTFVSVDYNEVQIDKNTSERRLSGITIKNSAGRTITLNIDKYAKLHVDTIPVKIEAFKIGMEIEAEVNLRRVKTLRGSTDTASGQIEHRDKTVIGTVTRLDPGGKSVSIRLDNGQAKTYYINNRTEVFKGTALMDLSVLYEGDRVKLVFSEYNTNFIESIDITVQGIKVESLYKGKISKIDPISKRVYLHDEMIFKNWGWYPNTFKSNSYYSYSQSVPIYAGNQQIKPDQLRHYANHDIYFATVSQFGKEVIEKMIIKKSNERTFYEPMTAVNSNANWISFNRIGKVPFHDGTILIRNGRLIDPISLQSSGKAFVVTEGKTISEFANVVYITNDGFQSPSLDGHEIYFGKISNADSYDLSLTELYKLTDNAWSTVVSKKFSYSNDTSAVEDFKTGTLDIIPHVDFPASFINGRYGYFYVKDGHVVAAHLLDKKITVPRLDSLVSVGRFDGFNSNAFNIRIRNVSQWNLQWDQAPAITNMDISQATLIRDGKVIPASQLQQGDRIYLLHKSSVKGRILLVN